MSIQQTQFQRFAHIILFVGCELIAFILIVNFNQKQKDIFLHSSSIFSGNILKKTTQIRDYLSLQKSNDDLLKENARLLNEIINMPRAGIPVPDSSQLSYEVIPARVIKNSISSLRNILTLDRGLNANIKSSFGVTTTDGIVGIINKSNDKYSSLLSLLNVDIRISASIENEDFFGTISWDGQSYNSLKLSGVPIHASLNIGARVITNGYSTIFPPGLPIGIIKAYGFSKDGAFYDIEVSPIVDFTNLEHVYVLKDNFAKDIISLELDE